MKKSPQDKERLLTSSRASVVLLTGFFDYWRTVYTRDREIVEAVVSPVHRGPSPEFAQALQAWPGTFYWSTGDGPGRLVLIPALGARPRERWWLHAALFIITFMTVAAGGAFMAGETPLRPAPEFALTLGWVAEAASGWWEAVRGGVGFAMALMAILLTHECGHYFLAKRYRISVSPPYFLPAPYQINLIGTFGAFIRLRSPIADRRQLMDVGAAGPWAGFVVATAFLLVGLAQSHQPAGGIQFSILTPVLGLPDHGWGDSLVTLGLRRWIVGDVPVLLHPLAIAGWFGVFITGLNLLPLGQLDGGHVLHALIGRRQGAVAILVWLSLIPLGLWFLGWPIWALLILLLSRGRMIHPSVVDRHRKLPWSRVAYGWTTMLLFLVTFTPVPLHLPVTLDWLFRYFESPF